MFDKEVQLLKALEFYGDIFSSYHIFLFQLSLNSEPHIANPVPRNTLPNPFHLHTEVLLFPVVVE